MQIVNNKLKINSFDRQQQKKTKEEKKILHSVKV
jgi:hypothetical protein